MKQSTTLFIVSLLLTCIRLHANSVDDDYDCGPSSTGPCSETNTKVSCSEARNICRGCRSSIILPRPQGRDTAAFFFPYLYGTDMQGQCFTGFVGFRFQQTFKDRRIAECLFDSHFLDFEGSQVPDRRERALVADYFGLAPNFRGFMTFNPRIQNYNVDFSGRAELASWADCLSGTYFQLNATATHSKWDLRACETTRTPSGSPDFNKFPGCYMSSDEADTVSTLQAALVQNPTFGNMNERREFGNFRFDSISKTGLANIDMILGYDFIRTEGYHFGGFILGSAPTGNHPNPEFVFSPIIGNGHHWELGGGITAHWSFWNCGDQSLGLYLDGHAEHLFKDTQSRSFDFRDSDIARGCLSRYMLLKEFEEFDGNDLYAGRIIPAINFTTRSIQSSFSVQGDASIRLLYRVCGVATAVGYNVYGRSHEKIKLGNECCNVNNRKLGIKGTTGVCAFLAKSEIPLTSTQSFARITTVTDEVDNQILIPESRAWNDVEARDSSLHGHPAPVLVHVDDLRIVPLPSYLTHKFFAHIDYEWEDCDAKPYVGVGGEVEFADKGNQRPCTLNMWGAWVRFGVSF